MGALIGISLCAALVGVGHPLFGLPLYLVAPLGATAVLLFCVPNSPLAQPWSAVIGNVSSALVAYLAIIYVPSPLTVGVAVGGAITAMMMVRALHPPGGAVALLAALDSGPVVDVGAAFAFVPVGVTTTTLVASAVVYNRLTGRVYPFRQAREDDENELAVRLGLTTSQLGELLVRFNQATNLGVADLGRLLAAAESEAAQHRFQGAHCEDVMTKDLITIRPDTPLPRIARLFQKHAIKSLPVVDEEMQLKGIVLQADLLAPIARNAVPTPGGRSAAQRRAADVMRPADRTVAHDLPVGVLLNRLAVQGSEVVPVTRHGILSGVLTRSDIIGLLLRDAWERDAA